VTSHEARTTFFLPWFASLLPFSPAVLRRSLTGAEEKGTAPEVEVTAVKFVTPARSQWCRPVGNWLEADIGLSVHPAPGSPGLMVSRVRVALLLGCELPALATAERRTEYYRAEAECVALEAGRTDVRFYLRRRS